MLRGIVLFVVLIALFILSIAQGMSVSSLIDLPSVFIVLGGTITLLLFVFPLSDWGEAIGFVFSGKKELPKVKSLKLSRFYEVAGEFFIYSGVLGTFIGFVLMLMTMQEESTDMYNLEATPAEGTSYRLAIIDKKKYPDIIYANQVEYKNGAAPFYTNSTHLPVNYSDDIYETLTLQDDLQTKYTGGTVMHMYLGENISDSSAVKNLIKKIVTKFRLPYLTLSPTFSVCPSHGYLNGRQERCPSCDSETEIYSRVVGYLRPIKQWNNGKQAEFGMRKMFSVG